MKISATVQNSGGEHRVSLQTNDHQNTLEIASKTGGSGSSVNGGELLFLALATCYCNDIYREAARREIVVERVEVTVEGDFEAEGAGAKNISYQAKVFARASEAEIESLMRDTDRVAEIQNTLRGGAVVDLTAAVAISVQSP